MQNKKRADKRDIDNSIRRSARGPGRAAPAGYQRRRAARGPADSDLRDTRVMYENLFENSPDANLLVNADGRIVSANRRAEEMFGYARAELLGQSIHLLVPEDKREEHLGLHAAYLRKPIPRTMARVQALNLELAARRKDGSVFPCEITLTPIQTAQGLLVMSVVRDSSERADRERALHHQAELVRLLSDVAMAANEATSVSSAFQAALERIMNHLHWTLGHAHLVEEDGRLTPLQAWAGSDAHELDTFRAVSDAMRTRPGSGLVGTVQISGQPLWLGNLPGHTDFARAREAGQAGLRTGLAVPVIVQKDVVGVLEFFHTQEVPPDLNLINILELVGVQLGHLIERKRAEESLRKTALQLRMVMNNLPVFLAVVSRDGKLLLLEGKGVLNAGIHPEELIGKNLFTELNASPAAQEPVRRALAGEEIHVETPTASGAVFETFYTPFYDANWAVDGVIGLSFDVSERKRMEGELDEIRHRLLDSIDVERGRLAQQLHDGPLQDLYGAFYQIQEIKNSLGEADQELANRALQTIQGVNATLRVITGELHPDTLIHLGLDKAIRSHAGRLQERLTDTILHLDLNEDGQSLPTSLRLGLYRVYQQLIANAADHSNARHIWVSLHIRPDQVQLEVQDNGDGFTLPKHWIELVRQGKYGLANALERVESLDGTLKVESQPERGTLVSVSVPRKAD